MIKMESKQEQELKGKKDIIKYFDEVGQNNFGSKKNEMKNKIEVIQKWSLRIGLVSLALSLLVILIGIILR